jgi:hypothetical protein
MLPGTLNKAARPFAGRGVDFDLQEPVRVLLHNLMLLFVTVLIHGLILPRFHNSAKLAQIVVSLVVVSLLPNQIAQCLVISPDKQADLAHKAKELRPLSVIHLQYSK